MYKALQSVGNVTVCPFKINVDDYTAILGPSMHALSLCFFHSNSPEAQIHTVICISYDYSVYIHTILDIITCSYLLFVASSQEPKASLQCG